MSVAGEAVAAAPAAAAHDMQQLARNVVAAHKRVRPAGTPACPAALTHRPQLDELARALPASQQPEAQLARIAALRADLEASGAELDAELQRAGDAPACRLHCHPPLPPLTHTALRQPLCRTACAASLPPRRTWRSAASSSSDRGAATSRPLREHLSKKPA